MSDRKHRVAEKKKDWARKQQEIARKSHVPNWPLWVHLGLADMLVYARRRSTAWKVFWGAAVLGSACALAGIWEGNLVYVALPLVLVAMWCWLAIHWVDQHGHWPEGA